jgi:hypothetical protein
MLYAEGLDKRQQFRLWFSSVPAAVSSPAAATPCLQLFVPLLSPHLAGSPAVASSGLKGSAHTQQQQPQPQHQHQYNQQQQQQHNPIAGVFTLLEEVALRQSGGLTGEDIDKGIGQPLEQLGVSLTFGE